MVFETAFCEDVYFSEHIFYCKNSVDCTHVAHNEIAYNCIDCYNSQQIFSCVQSSSCSFSSFLYSCSGCNYCTMCSNLVNKSYCIENKQYASKIEYDKALAEYLHLGQATLYTRFVSLLNSPDTIKSALQGVQNESVYGANTTMSKNSSFVYNANNIKDCKYSSMIFDAQDCYDIDSW